VDVHLVDGTYELFRHHYALPSRVNRAGHEVAATRGVLASLLGLLEAGATHVGVATDHVVESFRNDLFRGYKTGEGIEPALRAQFEPLEVALDSMGLAIWPMVEYEADDALATAARVAATDGRVRRAWICTPDKDLAQCVVGNRVVQHDRRRGTTLDEAGVREKFGVEPASIPDYLALVGDSADGFPGLPGWGARSAAAVLSSHGRIESIPDRAEAWLVKVRGAAKLAQVLRERRDEALLYRRLATLVADVPGIGGVDHWHWLGPRDSFPEVCDDLEAPELIQRASRLVQARTASR